VTDFDENRELCPDGNCLGVLVDGKCNVCGLGSDGRASVSEPPLTNAATASDDPLDEERQLCPDGACIGIIGSDGKCKECGRSAAS
jgi:hypothetical protein